MKVKYYDPDGIWLHNGNCHDVLPTLGAGSVDLVILDMPYGTTNLDWDAAIDLPLLWAELRRVCTPTALQVAFSAQPFTTDLIASNRKAYRYELIWHKTMATGFLDANRRPLRAHENIVVFCDAFGKSIYNPQMLAGERRKEHASAVRQPVDHYSKISDAPWHDTSFRDARHPHDVLHFSNGHGGTSLHPTAKPLPLVEWLMSSYSNPGMTVLDPFAGSGPVLVAAKKLGRKGIGIEVRADYCRVILDRLQQSALPLAEVAS